MGATVSSFLSSTGNTKGRARRHNTTESIRSNRSINSHEYGREADEEENDEEGSSESLLRGEHLPPADVSDSESDSEHPDWRVYDTPALTKYRFDWESPILTIGVVVGVAGELISLPLWINSFGSNIGGPYFILLFSSVVFAVVFFVLYLGWWVIRRGRATPSFFQYWWLYVLIGAFNAINGLLLVYASPPRRTPPILQALLINTTILWGMLSTRLLINKRDTLPVCRWPPMLSLLCVVAGIALSLSPLIHDVVIGKEKVFSGDSGIIWCIVFIIAVAPAAIFNVLQERFLKARKKEEKKNPQGRNRSYDMLAMLAWSCLFQSLFIGVFFWTDIIPHYGFSDNMEDFGNNLWKSFKCNFGVLDGCDSTGWHGAIFICSYFLAYFSSAGLNESSANYNLIANTLGSPVTAIFWLIFSNLNPESSHSPLWSVLPALALLVGGSIIWKLWENREKRKILDRAKRKNLLVTNG